MGHDADDGRLIDHGGDDLDLATTARSLAGSADRSARHARRLSEWQRSCPVVRLPVVTASGQITAVHTLARTRTLYPWARHLPLETYGCRRSQPAAYRRVNSIAAILPAPTMRFAQAPRGIGKGRPHDLPSSQFRSVHRPHGRSGARIARCRPRRPRGEDPRIARERNRPVSWIARRPTGRRSPPAGASMHCWCSLATCWSIN